MKEGTTNCTLISAPYARQQSITTTDLIIIQPDKPAASGSIKPIVAIRITDS